MNTISLVSHLLPPGLLQDVALQDQTQSMKTQRAIGLFVINLLFRTKVAMEKHDYKRFDANPGDAQCQNQALLLHDLYQNRRQVVENEIGTLLHTCTGEKRRKGRACGLKEVFQTATEFTQLSAAKQKLENLTISEDLLYLLHCIMSNQMAVPSRLDEKSGIIDIKSDYSRLEQIESSMNKVPSTIRSDMLEFNQEYLSALTASLFHKHISAHYLGKEGEHALTIQMLASEHRVTRGCKGHLPKTYTCLFYAVRALFDCLSAENALICLEEIVRKEPKSFKPLKKPFQIFLQLNGIEPNASIVDVENLPLSTQPVIVIEAVMSSRDEVIKTLATHSLKEILLRQCAHEPPYERKSTLQDVQDDKARQEILDYRKFPIPDMIHVDHIYFAIKTIEKMKPTFISQGEKT